MKIMRTVFYGWLPAMVAAAAQAGVVDGNERELFTTGDFDGDGMADVVIVDRESGFYSIGNGGVDGSISWEAPRSSGMRGIDDLAAGRLLSEDRDAVAFVSRSENRINYMDAMSPSPGSLFGNLIGPSLVVVLPIAGDGAIPGLEDVISAGRDAGPPLPYMMYAARNLGDKGFVDMHGFFADYLLHSGNRYYARTGEPPLLSMLQRREGDAEDRFFLLEPSEAGYLEHAAVPLAMGSAYDHGDFRGAGLADLVGYLPGESGFEVYHTDESGGEVALASRPLPFDLDSPVERIRVLRESDGARLLVLYRNGSAVLYAFDGVEPPVALEVYSAHEGRHHFTGAAMLGDDGFVLFSGEPGGPSTAFSRAGGATRDYRLLDSGKLPGFPAEGPAGNLLLFAGEPFVEADPLLIGRMSAGVWASGPEFLGDDQRSVGAWVERFGDAGTGLHNPEWQVLGSAPAGSRHLLGNQYGLTDSVSFFSYDTSLGETAPVPGIQPHPGNYPTSLAVSFPGATVPDDRTVYYRIGGAAWREYEEPFWLYRDTVVEFFSETAVGGSRILRSPFGSAAYTFAAAPEAMDSDGDGVPDFVEIHYDLDPVGSGPDADGDGVSDLEEILAGTDPADSGSYPDERDTIDLGASFNLSVFLQPFDGTADEWTTAGHGTGVRAYGNGGRLLRDARVDERNEREFPAVVLDNLPVEPADRFFIVRSDPHYPVKTDAEDNRIGREMVAVISMPRFPAPEVDFRYGESGGTLADEAAAWVEAAREAYRSAPERVGIDIDEFDTLHAALVERRIALLLREKGVLDENEAARASLFPFRSRDAGRRLLTRSEVLLLEQGAGDAYSLVDLTGAIWEGMVSDDILYVDTLFDLATDIFRISSRHNNEEPGAYDLPLDVFRGFLPAGELPEAYLERTRLTERALADAHSAALELLSLSAGLRTSSEWTLEVLPETFAHDCTPLRNASGVGTVSLFDRFGEPYRFPGGFPVAAGSVLRVEGYQIMTGEKACSGTAIEVVSLALESVPTASPEDQDGNLLPDPWERYFFGETGRNPFRSYDGSGYSALQQYLEGSDPTDPLSLPADAPAEDLSPPAIRIGTGTGGPGELRLSWSWPERYAERIGFSLEVSEGLNGGFISQPMVPSHDGNGGFSVELDRPESDRHFYRVVLSLE